MRKRQPPPAPQQPQPAPQQPQPAPQQPQPESRLGGVRALAHDEDERPSREDRSYGETIFTRPPVPLPRLLRGRRHRP